MSASLLDVAKSATAPSIPPAPPPPAGPATPEPCRKCGSIEFYSYDLKTGRPKFCKFCNPPKPRTPHELYILVERQVEWVCVKQSDELRIMGIREMIRDGRLSADDLPPKQIDFEDWWIAIGGFGVSPLPPDTPAPAATTTTTPAPKATKSKNAPDARQTSLLSQIEDLTDSR